MSNLQIIEQLCALLDDAQRVIRDQAALLALHGISTDDEALERERAKLLSDIERST